MSNKVSLHHKEFTAEITKFDIEDVNRYINSKSVTSMVIEGENWRYKYYTKHIQDATSLALMSKREIYEKLINNRSKGEMRN